MPSPFLHDHLPERIAPWIRKLGPGELLVRPVQRHDLAVRVALHHRAEFTPCEEDGWGDPPDGTVRLRSMAELQARVQEALRTAVDEAAQRLDAWVSARGSEYRAAPSPDDCLAEQEVYGIEAECGPCDGNGQVTCTGCGGAGSETCRTCDGTAQVRCPSCGGSVETSCPNCGGRGTRTEISYPAVYRNGQWVNDQVMTTVGCSGCGGNGRRRCGCGTGWVRCSNCVGGRVTCSTCAGSGREDCGTCHATGTVHTLWWVECTVERDVALEVDGGDPADRQVLWERVPFDDWGELGSGSPGLALQGSDPGPQAVTLHYAGAVPREVVEAEVRARAVEIRGYGPEARVFDHRGIAEMLLEPDRAALDEALGGTSPLAAARRFFDSELHDRVAEAQPEVLRLLAAGNAPEAGALAMRSHLVGQPRDYPGNVVRNTLLLSPYRAWVSEAGWVMRPLLIVFGLAWAFIAIAVALFSDWTGGLFLYLLFAAAGIPFIVRGRRAARREEARRHEAEARGEDPDIPDDPGVLGLIALGDCLDSGMVSAEYLTRAADTVERAIPALARPLLRPALLAIVATAAAVLWYAGAYRPEWAAGYVAGWLAPGVLFLWVAAEFWSRRRMREMFGPHLHGRLAAPLARVRNRYRWGLAGTLAGMVALFLWRGV